MTDVRDFRYRYDAIVTEVYDGDTIYVDIDLGLNTWRKGIALRLHGVDTPELKKATRAAGEAARDFVCAALAGIPIGNVQNLEKRGRRIVLGSVPIFLHSHGDDDGKYGRLLSTVWFYDSSGQLLCLNEILLTEGHAVVPSYS